MWPTMRVGYNASLKSVSVWHYLEAAQFIILRCKTVKIIDQAKKRADGITLSPP